MTTQDPGYGVFHEGELQAHQRYGVANLTRGLANNVRRVLTPALVQFLERQPYGGFGDEDGKANGTILHSTAVYER